MNYGITKTTSLDVAAAEAHMRDALATQGFGVLTYIDVAATLKEKLGVEREDYRILGACNPGLANEALSAEEGLGLLLPCNVIVRAGEGTTVVSALDPALMSSVTENPQLDTIAGDARSRLEAALETLPA